MTPNQIAVVADLVRRRSGAQIDTDKIYVIETRLQPVARREGFTSIGELVDEIQGKREETLIWAVVEAMASTETQFFRDRRPFEQMRDDILPALAQARRGEAKIWSIGCSTGQEPYSLAMLIDEEAGRFPGLKIDILAGDISERCLEKAHSGVYSQFEVQRGLPARLLIKHFEKVDESWVLSPRIRQAVRLQRVNVLKDIEGAGPFDVILCRNVLTRFEATTRQTVLDRLAMALAEDGYLIIGATEVFEQMTPAFRPVSGRPGLFVRDPAYNAVAA